MAAVAAPVAEGGPAVQPVVGERFEFAVLVKGRACTAEWLADLLRNQGLTVETTAVRRETHHLLLIRLPLHAVAEAAEQVLHMESHF